jgi:DNA-binding transcriptional ArsR family regulator
MVHEEKLDAVLSAIADSTRRGILARLGNGPATIGQLAEPTGMTLTGMTKHVQILEHAGLVTTVKVGRSRECRLDPEPLNEVSAWIEHYRQLWERRLDGLELYFTLKKGQQS